MRPQFRFQNEKYVNLNPIQDELFQGWSRMREAKKPPPHPIPLKPVTHILKC